MPFSCCSVMNEVSARSSAPAPSREEGLHTTTRLMGWMARTDFSEQLVFRKSPTSARSSRVCSGLAEPDRTDRRMTSTVPGSFRVGTPGRSPHWRNVSAQLMIEAYPLDSHYFNGTQKLGSQKSTSSRIPPLSRLRLNQVAALLKDFEIRPVVVHPTKRADLSRHGYRAAQFEDAFARFLPPEPNIRTLKHGDGSQNCWRSRRSPPRLRSVTPVH
jgi:hypothetical protein